MEPDMQQVLYRRQRQVLTDLGAVLPEVRDLGAASFFEQFEDKPAAIGFRDRGCSSRTLICIPGPKEASQGAHLHVEERYGTSPPHALTFYRYEICWEFTVVLSAPPNDHLRDSMVSVRRGVRFDHHPRIEDPGHPVYHWHPNGCSELRLSTGRMTALKAVAVALLMFRPERLTAAVESDSQVRNTVEELRREIPSLPWV